MELLRDTWGQVDLVVVFLLDLMDVMGVNGVSWDLGRDLVRFHWIQKSTMWRFIHLSHAKLLFWFNRELIELIKWGLFQQAM
jgi:hypothetical protein